MDTDDVNDEKTDFETLENLLNSSELNRVTVQEDPIVETPRNRNDDKQSGLALLEALPQVDSAKQFKNLGLVILFTALMSINYVVPNIKLVSDYSGPAENDRYVNMTLSYMIAPIFITSLINLAWYIDDDLLSKEEGRKVTNRRTWCIRGICLILQMGTVLRFAQSLYYGYKSKNTEGTEKVKYATKMSLMEKDATLLRSFTAFLQGVPQFALQLYILTEGPKNIVNKGISWQLLSVAGCLGGITWGAVSCDRILGSSSKDEIISDWRIIITIMLPWRLFTIAARMTVLALFSTLFPGYFGLGCIAHYAIMYLLIQHQKVDTQNGTRSEVFLFLVGGIVYIITDLLVKYERSYHKYIVYYGIVFAENSLMLAVWFFYTDISTAIVRGAIILGVNVSFVIGLCFLRLFYEFSHPNVPRYCLSKCCQSNLLLTVDADTTVMNTPKKKVEI